MSKFDTIREAATRASGKAHLLLGKHSPTIMFSAGVVGMVATTVLASKATLKLEDKLVEIENTREAAKELNQNSPDRYSDEELRGDLVKLYARQVTVVARLYAPTICVGVVSVALLTGSHVVLTRRNTALMAAYATIDKAFKGYRARVEEAYGEQRERELYQGVEEQDIETRTKNGEIKHKTVKKAAGLSPYAKMYNEHHPLYVKSSPELNVAQLRMWQESLNTQLRLKGHLFLNEAYDQLDYPRTKAGQMVGWMYDPKHGGDGYVDFGIFDDERMESLMDFMSRRETEIVLDFNVDGVIYDKI